jgi:hypothetical protein
MQLLNDKLYPLQKIKFYNFSMDQMKNLSKHKV